MRVPVRSDTGPFLFAVDHCFLVKGQGTVLTGTVLAGKVSVNDNIEIAELKLQRKVKSMQMFRTPVSTAVQGDRVGICVTHLEAAALERGLAATPGTIPTFHCAIARVHKVRFYKRVIASKEKLHLSVGHATVMATVQFISDSAMPIATAATADDGEPFTPFDVTQEYEYKTEIPSTDAPCWVILQFETPVTCPANGLVIGSHLDSDIQLNQCRLAFYGRLSLVLPGEGRAALNALRVFKRKQRIGGIDRVQDDYTVIGKGLFKKETNMAIFTNLKIRRDTGEEGVIEGAFGKSGKFKVNFRSGGQQALGTKGELKLEFKQYVFSSDKKIFQT
eukprot:TRINITY_DN6144_c0_g1_i2.p1 TRINITY_DN6144_c0_g1~~TRINITY_DN6144_c0_g1_i2.p1  ORF type:complete len:333 (-),score=78.06 TRINITY_DN6144_c0_g1_i2:726-1724(-)